MASSAAITKFTAAPPGDEQFAAWVAWNRVEFRHAADGRKQDAPHVHPKRRAVKNGRVHADDAAKNASTMAMLHAAPAAPAVFHPSQA